MLKYILVFLTIGTAAWAQCDCNRAIPLSGDYQIVGPDFSDVLTVIVSDGPNGECGGTLDFIHPKANAHLTCQGNQYFGVIDFMQQPIMLESTSPTTVFSTATSFQGVIQRPAAIALVPNEPFTPNFTLTLISETTRAPDCMCENVEAWIDSSRNMIAKYSDTVTLDYALTNKLAGLDWGQPAWPNTSLIGSYTPATLNENTYQRLVTDQVTQLPIAGEELVEYLRAEASTNREDCSYTTGDPRTGSGMCRPGIVMEAIAAHENKHSLTCEAIIAETNSPNGFLYWSNHPPNHAQDEIEAYTATLDVLVPWYETNCQ